MKKLLFTLLATICFSGLFAQEKSVAIVRHIIMIGQPEDQQRLIVSRPGVEAEIIDLKQRYMNKAMNKEIDHDNQEMIRVFTSLLNEGYELETSSDLSFTAGAAGFSSHNGGRETIYIFIKE